MRKKLVAGLKWILSKVKSPVVQEFLLRLITKLV